MALISLAVMAAGLPEKYKSLAAIRWALATLNSRTMFLEGDNSGVLMPFGDLHNHSPPPGPQLPDLGVQLYVNMPFQPPMLAKTSGFHASRLNQAPHRGSPSPFCCMQETAHPLISCMALSSLSIGCGRIVSTAEA